MLYMVLLLGVLLMLNVLTVSMMVRRNRRYVRVIEGKQQSMQRLPESPFGG